MDGCDGDERFEVLLRLCARLLRSDLRISDPRSVLGVDAWRDDSNDFRSLSSAGDALPDRDATSHLAHLAEYLLRRTSERHSHRTVICQRHAVDIHPPSAMDPRLANLLA